MSAAFRNIISENMCTYIIHRALREECYIVCGQNWTFFSFPSTTTLFLRLYCSYHYHLRYPQKEKQLNFDYYMVWPAIPINVSFGHSFLILCFQ